jgi:hypothetical protein
VFPLASPELPGNQHTASILQARARVKIGSMSVTKNGAQSGGNVAHPLQRLRKARLLHARYRITGARLP